MTNGVLKTAMELDKRAQRLGSMLSDLHDLAEGGTSRMDPLNQREPSKQTAVRNAIGNGAVSLPSDAWEQIYGIVEKALKNQIDDAEGEFAALCGHVSIEALSQKA